MRKIKIIIISILLLAGFSIPGNASANFIVYAFHQFGNYLTSANTYIPIKDSIDECVEYFSHDQENPIYAAEKGNIQYNSTPKPGETFQITIQLTNSGNTIWLGDNSYCPTTTFMRLGTSKDYDRASKIRNKNDESAVWLSDNRIRMKESIIHPGETATFIIEAQAPTQSGKKTGERKKKTGKSGK